MLPISKVTNLEFLRREGPVEDKLDKFKRGCWSSNVTREADSVAANGDASSVGIFLLRVDFADNLGVGDLFAAVGWMSSYLMTNKVLILLTCLPCPVGTRVSVGGDGQGWRYAGWGWLLGSSAAGDWFRSLRRTR